MMGGKYAITKTKKSLSLDLIRCALEIAGNFVEEKKIRTLSGKTER